MQDLKIHNPAIVLENVDVHLGGLAILNGVNLSIGAGEFIVVLGPNGAGKTTLLKLLLGLIRPSAGLLQVLDRTPKRGNQAIGYVPQHRVIEPETPIRTRDLVVLVWMDTAGVSAGRHVVVVSGLIAL